MKHTWMNEALQDSQGWWYKITKGYGALTEEQKQQNALLVYSYFYEKMTLEAIAGLLGNMEKESQMNPGQVEGDSKYNVGWSDLQRGHGFIQWTDSKNYSNNPLVSWENESKYDLWASGTFQCERIWCEGTNQKGAGGCWLKAPKRGYTYTWTEFCELTDYEEATKAYMYERERAAVGDEANRVKYAKKWYEFLLKTTRVVVADTSNFDTSYKNGIHKGKITKENRYFLLTPHMPLYLFSNTHSASGTEYAYSDRTVELIEALIITYRGAIRQMNLEGIDLAKNPKTPMSVKMNSSYRPDNTSSMHGRGGAVDIGFFDHEGVLLDCKCIAVVAAELGFSGIAPLHRDNSLAGATSIIHLDTRADYVKAGGKYNTKFLGYELDDNNDDWYDAFNISPFSDHKSFYNLTDEQIEATLGKPFGTIILAPPRLSNLTADKISTESTDFSVTVIGENITSLFYTINGVKKELPVDTGKITFTASDLVPNTNYEISVTAINGGGSRTTPKLKFTTLQDYPDPIKSITLTPVGKTLETTTFKVDIERPERWGYWQRIKNSFGYRIFIVTDCALAKKFDNELKDEAKNDSFTIIPTTYDVDHNKNFQVGISTWVQDNDKEFVFARPDEIYPVCSNSILLKDISEVSDMCFTIQNKKINRVTPYIKNQLNKEFLPLNIFKL